MSIKKQTCREALRFYTAQVIGVISDPSTRAVAQGAFIAGFCHGCSAEEAVEQGNDTNQMLAEVTAANRAGKYFEP